MTLPITVLDLSHDLGTFMTFLTYNQSHLTDLRRFFFHHHVVSQDYHVTIRYDTIEEINVDSKAEYSLI